MWRITGADDQSQKNEKRRNIHFRSLITTHDNHFRGIYSGKMLSKSVL